MAIPRSLRKKYLDGKELFYLYHVEMGKGGSLNKLRDNLFKNGIYNPETGRPFLTSGIFQSMWRWALTNFKESEPIYKTYLRDLGMFMDDAVWRDLIRKRVKSYLNKTQQRKFYEDNPEYVE